MPARRLSSAESIELVDTNFKNENWERAAQEILEFWEDGVRSYVQMGERGSFSRSHYSNVVEEHFAVRYDDNFSVSKEDAEIDISELPIGRETFMELYREIYRDVYREAFQDGANWARSDE